MFIKMQENYRVHVFELLQYLHYVSNRIFLMRINVAPCVEEVAGV